MIIFSDVPVLVSKQYLRDAAIDTAKAISAFTGYSSTVETIAVLLQAETQDIRVRVDGTAPTATSGTLIKAGGEGMVIRAGDMTKVKVISATAGAACTATLLA